MAEEWEKRFWSNVYVDKSQGDNPCWLWRGPKFTVNNLTRGYFNLGSKTYRAHALAWQLLRGPVPESKFLLHHCDQGLCVRPDHMYLGDQKDNMADVRRRNRRG